MDYLHKRRHISITVLIHPKPHIHVETSFVWKHEYEAKDVQSIVIQIYAPFMQRISGQNKKTLWAQLWRNKIDIKTFKHLPWSKFQKLCSRSWLTLEESEYTLDPGRLRNHASAGPGKKNNSDPKERTHNYRAFSLTCQAPMQIYGNKRKC